MDEANSFKRPPVDEGGNSKRSRGMGAVTPNACTECRKKRAKCDGQRPCGRCRTQKNIECVYEVQVRQSKENMRAEIEKLRKYQAQTTVILAALKNTARADAVLQQIRRGESVEFISESIERSTKSGSPMNENFTTYERPSDQDAIRMALNPAQNAIQTLTLNDAYEMALQQPAFSGSNSQQWKIPGESSGMAVDVARPVQMKPFGGSTARMGSGPTHNVNPIIGANYEKTSGSSESDLPLKEARGKGQGTILGSPFGIERLGYSHPNYLSSWTTITSDASFVEHLMTLYFCWEYPTFASLSKEHFLVDFKAGRRRHCSSLLVNSILALGCRFSTQPRARLIGDDANTAGDHFFAEAKRLLAQETDRHSLTTIQALGLMSIREASCGRSSESVFLAGQAIRLTVEMGLHLESVQNAGGEASEDETAARAATFWGAFSLDQAWSLSIGRLPCFSKDTKLIAKPAIIDHIERSSWVPYTDDGVPIEKSCTQPSNVRSVFQTFCELSEIVHKHLYAFYSPGNSLTSKVLLDTYTNYLSWYEAIPLALRLGQNFTPAVLFAHMYYHYAILLLFRPFVKLKIIDSSVSPKEVCTQAADAISALVNSYSRLYTLRRTPSFVPYFVLTASITHLATHGHSERAHEKVLQAAADLREMKTCHRFASRAYDILRFFIHHWKANVNLGEYVDVPAKLCLAASTSTNQFCPNHNESFNMMKGLGPPTSDDESPLFWAFPLQGRPIIATGPALEQAGFEILDSAS